MGKPKPPKGMYRESVHDGSSVTISRLKHAPSDGNGKHTKSIAERIWRHYRFKIKKELESHMD